MKHLLCFRWGTSRFRIRLILYHRVSVCVKHCGKFSFGLYSRGRGVQMPQKYGSTAMFFANQAAARSSNDCILRYGIKYTDIKLCRAYTHGIKTERKSLRLTNFQFLRPLKKFAPCSENRFILQRRPLPIKKVTAVEIGVFDAVFGGRLPRRFSRNR